jgi:hypothetical protein
MSTTDPERRDARHCPQCGAMGILPLGQPAGDHGEIQDPVMICPICDDEFRATGMRWLGAFSPPNLADITDDELDAWADQFVEAVLGGAVQDDGDPR